MSTLQVEQGESQSQSASSDDVSNSLKYLSLDDGKEDGGNQDDVSILIESDDPDKVIINAIKFGEPSYIEKYWEGSSKNARCLPEELLHHDLLKKYLLFLLMLFLVVILMLLKL